MIDLHAHILPGLDDGPQTLAESIKMCRIACEDGIEKIVATPHTKNGVYQNSREEILKAVTELNNNLKNLNIPIHIYPGSDIRIDTDIFDLIDDNQLLTVNDNKRYIMIEFSEYIIPPQMEEWIFKLKLKKITPIFTHPERNMIIQKDLDIAYRLVENGGLIQITAMSLTNDWGKSVKKCADELVKARLVHIIASDAHSPIKRPPILSRALAVASELIGDEIEAKKLVTTIPQAIIDGTVYYPPDPVRKKTSFFKKFF